MQEYRFGSYQKQMDVLLYSMLGTHNPTMKRTQVDQSRTHSYLVLLTNQMLRSSERR